MSSKRFPLIALVVAGFALFLGCGDDDEGSEFTPAAGGAAGSGGTGTGGTGGVVGTGGSVGGAAGASGAAGAAGSSCDGESLGFTPDCSTCLEQKCCSEASECASISDCTGLLACSLACSDDPCRQDCLGQFPDGMGSYNGLVLCLGDQADGCNTCPF